MERRREDIYASVWGWTTTQENWHEMLVKVCLRSRGDSGVPAYSRGGVEAAWDGGNKVPCECLAVDASEVSTVPRRKPLWDVC